MADKKILVSSLKPNPGNPRFIKDDSFKKLCQSIKDLPKMMELRPIVVDENNVMTAQIADQIYLQWFKNRIT